MSPALNIGVVPYLNALPLIEGMSENPQIKLVSAPPARLEADIDGGLLDAALIPVVSLFSRPHLSMFSFSGIAADYEAGSVLFFSRGGDLRRIAYDEGSRASVMLLRLLLAEKNIAPNDWIPMEPYLDKMLEDADGALLIGDAALVNRRDTRLDFDLVDRWRKWTNLPFVFAVWAARASHPRRAEMTKLFTESSIRGISRLESIAQRRSGFKGLSSWEILTYYKKNMVYRLGKSHMDAIDLFREKTSKLLAPLRTAHVRTPAL